MSARAYLAIVVLLFTMSMTFNGCGGGGGDSTPPSSDDSSLPPEITQVSVPELFDQQNSKVLTYFSKVEQLMESTDSVEDRLFWMDPTDTIMMDEIIDDTEKNYILTEEIFDIGEELLEIEQRLQENIVVSTSTTNKRLLVEISPQIAPIVVLGVCTLGLTGASFLTSQYDNYIWFKEEAIKCSDSRKQQEESILNSNISQEDRDSLLTNNWEVYRECKSRADDIFHMTYYHNFAVGGVSIVGPASAPYRLARISLSSISAAIDVTQLYIFGTRSASSSKVAPLASGSNLATAFVATTDQSGSISVPEGEWDIVVSTPGHVRSGTRPDQSVSVREGETLYVDFSTVPTSSATSEDLESCEAGTEPVTGICKTPISTAEGETGAYYYVKGFYYPMPDSSRCYSAEQIAYYESSSEHSVFGDPDRGSCTICPDGYALGDYEGLQSCMRCPDGKDISDGCCY